MKRFTGVYYLFCLVLLFGVFGGLFGGQIVLAAQESSNGPVLLPPSQEEQPPPEAPVEEKLELVSKFPVARGESGTPFEFEVNLLYQGSEPRVFEFALTAPPGWEASILRPWGGEENKESLLAIRLEPERAWPDRVKIILAPLPGNLPGLGDYVLTFEATSGDVRDSIELKAVVTDIALTYDLDMITTTGRFDIPVKAGENNHVSIKLINSGTGVLRNISFTSVKSEGWGITFTPNRVESLEPGVSREVDVVITPPRKTIAGDYRVLLGATGVKGYSSISARVRVQTPTIWGGVGIGIVSAVIAGLAVLFRRLGRR